jgi:hypothetical protein
MPSKAKGNVLRLTAYEFRDNDSLRFKSTWLGFEIGAFDDVHDFILSKFF